MWWLNVPSPNVLANLLEYIRSQLGSACEPETAKTLLRKSLKDAGRAHAPTDAHRHHAITSIATLELAQN